MNILKIILQKVRKITSKNGIVLIFDECASDLKELWGLHLHFKVNPDIAIFGKALGNGYAITAIIEENIMETAQDSFISSTFWTERIGPAAHLKRYEMKKLKSWKIIDSNGKYIIKNWINLAKNMIWILKLAVYQHYAPLNLMQKMRINIRH